MARIFLTNDEKTDAAGDGAEIFGQTGDESVTLLDGYTGFLLDGNIEEVGFEGSFADYTFDQQGINLLVKNSDDDLIATLSVQNDEDGTQLNFADGMVNAAFDSSNVIVLEPEAVEPVTVEIDGSAIGPLDASGADVTYEISAGEYTQEIIDFALGDVLDFPEGVDPTLVQNDFNDGVVGIQYAEGGQVAIIELTGLDTADDAQLLGISDLDAVFGEGTLI